MCAKFGTEIFRGYDFTGGLIFDFPIGSCMGLRKCGATALPVIRIGIHSRDVSGGQMVETEVETLN